jgi:hypothetical protein
MVIILVAAAADFTHEFFPVPRLFAGQAPRVDVIQDMLQIIGIQGLAPRCLLQAPEFALPAMRDAGPPSDYSTKPTEQMARCRKIEADFERF